MVCFRHFISVPLPTLSAHSPNKTTHLALIHISRPIGARSPSVMSQHCHDTAFNLGTPGTATSLYPQPPDLRTQAEPYGGLTLLGNGLKR